MVDLQGSVTFMCTAMIFACQSVSSLAQSLPTHASPWTAARQASLVPLHFLPGFPGGSEGKASACNAGDLGRKDPLEKEMATHSSILAWTIPWTEKPGGLPFTGPQRLGHD